MLAQQDQEHSKANMSILSPHQWVDDYADYLFKYAVVRVTDHDVAKDLVQETFLSALKGMANFKGQSSERTWLVAILKHKIIDHYRKESASIAKTIRQMPNNENEMEFFEADNGHWKSDMRPMPFSEVDQLKEKEFITILKQCLQKMPALWSSVFTMKHIDEEQTDVILEELRITQANFWVIIHRAKLSLRACLQKHWL